MYNMRPHKARSIVNAFEKYLPYRYISQVIERCKAKGQLVNSQYVRDVKRLQKKDALVLGVILEFAREHEKEHKKLERLAEAN